MPKTKSPPVNLYKYLEGRKHKYMTYQQAARHYGLPYWGFVKVAKEAKATWKLRKTAIVDTVVFDKYLEELFSMGLHSFQTLAKDAGAVRKVKGCVLVNLEKVEQFVESFGEEEF